MRTKSIDSTETPTALELAWTAGILDGEGCISAYTRKSSNGKSGQKLHQFVVTVTNTDFRIPMKLLKLFGGQLNETHGARLKPQWNEALRWCVYQRQAAAVLEAVMPYLVSKREQAEVALEFIATMTPQGGSRYRGLDPAIVERREEMTERLRVLKNRKEAV